MSKKKSRVIKVNVIYGDKNLKDCMEQVIQKHERSFDFLTLISYQSSNLRMRDILNEIYPDLFQNNIIIKLTI